MRIYTVRRGDTLYSISQAENIGLSALTGANQLTDPSKLVVGQALILPGGSTPGRSIVVNGYAFPNISDAAFLGAAPYLTYVSVFSARCRIDGSIQELTDTNLIRRAYLNGVAPVLTITNQRETGAFSGDIAHAILADETARERLIGSVMEYLDRRGYFGLNVDFEYIFETDRELYTAFLARLRERLSRVGYILMAALAPKISAEQQGILYTAHDYSAIGGIVDYAILMTYEWGYTYGEPMAVAPINRVEEVLSYAVTEITPSKLLMGMPNYGYNWALPYKQGVPARAVTLSSAPALAYEQYADIRYDDKAQAPYFGFYDSAGAERVVWFDDSRSIQARLKLIDKYDLGGASWWNINSLYRPAWAVLSSLYGIDKAFSE